MSTHKICFCEEIRKKNGTFQPAVVAQLDARLTEGQEVAGSTPSGWQHSFVEIDHEIFSVVIIYFPLIQKKAVFSFW